MTATTTLVDRWVAGWCVSRQMIRRRDGHSWLVEVAAESRSRERIFADPSLTKLRRLVAATTTADVWLTLVGELDASTRDAVSRLDPVTSGECMMTTRIEPGIVPAKVEIVQAGQVAHARIDVDGKRAASGQVAVSAGDAVFDRIETNPMFRRRGLGRLIMTGLAAWAAEHHATTGLLMASVSGRKLYESLGWSTVAPIVTLRGPGK